MKPGTRGGSGPKGYAPDSRLIPNRQQRVNARGLFNGRAIESTCNECGNTLAGMLLHTIITHRLVGVKRRYRRCPILMKHHHSKPNICFIQINALGLLVPETHIPFGGAEVRAMSFARMLRDSGHFDVSFAVLGGPPLSSVDSRPQGMAVFQMPPHRFHPTRLWVEILNFYKDIKADCFISLGANEVSHEMVAYARLLGLPTVVGIASDQSLMDSVFQGSMISNEYEIPNFHAWEALNLATSVLVQTQWQREWLYRKVGKRGCIIPNPIPNGWGETALSRGKSFPFDFLWVGRRSPDRTRRSSLNWPGNWPPQNSG